jgi:hypothetical protein
LPPHGALYSGPAVGARDADQRVDLVLLARRSLPTGSSQMLLTKGFDHLLSFSLCS